MVQIDQPEFGLAREFLLNDEEPTLQHYYNFMVDMSVIFGANVTTAPYELLDTLNLERALANVSTFFMSIYIIGNFNKHFRPFSFIFWSFLCSLRSLCRTRSVVMARNNLIPTQSPNFSRIIRISIGCDTSMHYCRPICS